MFCPRCGTAAEEHFRYCSKCGSELSGVAQEIKPTTSKDMATHVTVIGWLFMVSGVLTGLVGVAIVVAGRILPRLPIDWPTDIPFDLPRLAGVLAFGVGFATIAVGVGTFMAGHGLLQYKPWARIVAIIAAILGIFHFPLGTALGIYALWVLLSEPGRQYYQHKAVLAGGSV